MEMVRVERFDHWGLMASVINDGGPVTDQQQVTGNPLDQLREAQEVFREVLTKVSLGRRI